ncbi:MAG: hypothetical protein K2R98_24620 [Gemmataceae bacterium]|nr:hypothetical protein [Gemmataceae bacterium]
MMRHLWSWLTRLRPNRQYRHDPTPHPRLSIEALEDRTLLAAPVVGIGAGLSGRYFNGTNFNALVATRTDAAVNFDWGNGSPATGVGVDNFSARWTGQVQAQFSESYTFTTRSDDGVRLWVNGQLLINNWTAHSPTDNSGSIALVAGQKYDIVMEYYEAGYGAVAQLFWASASTPKQLIPTSQLYAASGAVVGTGTGLSARYFNGTSFNTQVTSRVDGTVNFDWGNGSPASGVGVDNFSARWTGQVQAQFSESYTFTTRSDDGVRLWVNGQLLINNWTAHSPTDNSGSIALVAGQKYDIVMEYYEAGYGAVAQLFWASASTPKQLIPTSQLYAASGAVVGTGTGLSARYFNGTSFNTQVTSRVDGTVNFDWGNGSPATGVGVDNFSARWTGQVQAQFSETYTFTTRSDDGVRLWVNGQLLINNWTAHAPTDNSGSIALVAGQKYDIVMEYYEAGYGAVAQLSWASASTPKQIIPTSQLYAAANDWFSTNLGTTALANLARSLQASDGTMSRADMLAIFGQVSQDGTVSATELADLRTLVSNSSLMGMADYVRNLANKVVNGDAANARYLGQALGNLTAGSAGGVLNNLVNKWFLGLDRPTVDAGVSYVVAQGTLFGAGGPVYTDILQGNVADCYFLAGLSELALRTPSVLRDMFIDNGDNTWTVRFYRNGVADYLTVDRFLPASGGLFVYANAQLPLGSSNNVLWVALAEKAYAQLAESGWSRSATANSYSSINLGWEGDVIQQVAARPVSVQVLGNEVSTFNAIVSAFATGKLVGLDSKNTTDPGIVANHVYVLVGYNPATQTFASYNPWGYMQQLTWSQLAGNFSYWSVG